MALHATDIDECATANVSKCASDRICINDLGGYHCGCPDGYALAINFGICQGLVQFCRQFLELGIFIAVVTPSIYSLDIDECSMENGGCDQHCHNIEGEYYCSCDEGYLLHIDLLQCVGKVVIVFSLSRSACVSVFFLEANFQLTCAIDFDECNLHNGDCSHECVNILGNYECSCPVDMTLDESGTICKGN